MKVVPQLITFLVLTGIGWFAYENHDAFHDLVNDIGNYTGFMSTPETDVAQTREASKPVQPKLANVDESVETESAPETMVASDSALLDTQSANSEVTTVDKPVVQSAVTPLTPALEQPVDVIKPAKQSDDIEAPEPDIELVLSTDSQSIEEEIRFPQFPENVPETTEVQEESVQANETDFTKDQSLDVERGITGPDPDNGMEESIPTPATQEDKSAGIEKLDLEDISSSEDIESSVVGSESIMLESKVEAKPPYELPPSDAVTVISETNIAAEPVTDNKSDGQHSPVQPSEPGRLQRDQLQPVVEVEQNAVKSKQDVIKSIQQRKQEALNGLTEARQSWHIGRHQQAIRQYQLLSNEFRNHPDFPGELGNIYFSRGEIESAVEAYSEALARQVRNGDIPQARKTLNIIHNLDQKQAAILLEYFAPLR